MFADKETMKRREEAAAIEWAKAKASAKRFGAGCLALSILALCGLFYLAGYAAGYC